MSFNVFNAKAVYALKLDRNFRIYFDSKKIFFIQTCKQKLFIEAVFEMLNTVFSGLGDSAQELLQKKIKTNKCRLDKESDKKFHYRIMELNNKDFVLSVNEIRNSILRSSRSDVHGTCFGVWKVVLYDGKKRNFQFETKTDFKVAQEILPNFLGNKIVTKIK